MARATSISPSLPAGFPAWQITGTAFTQGVDFLGFLHRRATAALLFTARVPFFRAKLSHHRGAGRSTV